MDGMTLLWLRVQLRARALLGIRDVRQFTLRSKIDELTAPRSA